MSLTRPPVRRKGDQFIISIGTHERQVVLHLLDELVELLADPASDPASETLQRLFPVVYETDPEREAEYQRLMREELVASKLGAISTVTEALSAARRNQVTLDEAGLVAVMQSINSIRLVLGTIVGVEDLERDEFESETVDEADGERPWSTEGDADARRSSPEYQLYGYLSWLLDWCVTAISDNVQ